VTERGRGLRQQDLDLWAVAVQATLLGRRFHEPNPKNPCPQKTSIRLKLMQKNNCGENLNKKA
jgi:hypothetical protein